MYRLVWGTEMALLTRDSAFPYCSAVGLADFGSELKKQKQGDYSRLKRLGRF